MKRLLFAAMLCLMGSPLIEVETSTPASAACPTPLVGKDGNNTLQNFGITTDASGNCYGNVGIVDGANAGNKATVTSGNALKVDGSSVTQPVSGSVTANQGGPWTVQQGSPPWPVSQSGPWAFTCSSGCSSSSNQIIAGQPNYPLQVNQVQGLVASFPFPALSATQIWDGQHYLSMVPPNGVATQAQTALVVRNPDTGNIGDAPFSGSGNASQIALEKAIYAGVTSSIPAGSNTIGSVNQAGAPWSVSGTVTAIQGGTWIMQQGTPPWSFTCSSGCTGGGGGGGTTELVNSAGQQLGANLPGQSNIPLQVNQTQGLVASFPFPSLSATQIWDGQHYLSLVPPNGSAQQAQTALVVRNPDIGNVADTAFSGSGNASQIALEKAIYAGVTSSIPAGSNTIGAVNQAGAPWSFTCLSGCTGGGTSSTVQVTNSAGQGLGGNIAGQVNIPVVTSQATTSLSPFSLLPSQGLWDGKYYAAFAPPNTPPMANQAALVVTLSPNSPASGTGANVNVSQFGGTNVVTGTGASGSGIPRFTVSNDSNILATQSGPWTVQQGSPPWSVVGNIGSLATDSGNPVKVGGVFNSTQPTATNGQRIDAQSTARGALIVATGVDAFSATVSGTVTANQGGAPWTVNPGTPANWGIGATGSAVPANAVLDGMSQGGNTTALTGTGGNLNVNLAANSFGTLTVGGTVTANQGSPPWSVSQFGSWNVGQAGTWTVQQGTPPWNIVNYDTGGRQLGSSLAGANNVPFVTTAAPTALSPAPLLPSQGLWDGKNYASFVPPNASATGLQPALVTTLSPNTPLPAGTNTIGGVTQVGAWTVQQGGAPWSVSQSGSPWGVSIQQGGNTAAVNASSQLSVTCANCSGSGVSQVDNTGFTFGSSNMVPIGGVYSSTPTQLTNGDAGVALLTQGRILQTNHRDSSGQELGESLPGRSNIPIQVNIASQVQNNTLLKSTDAYGQLRTATWLTDGTDYAALTTPFKPPKASDSALVVTPSPVPSIQCPFIQALNASATATVVTGQAGKFLHICSYKVIAAAALSFTLNEGTGTTCGTGTTPLDGGGSGSIALAANGGFQTGSGAGQVTIPMQVRGDNLCVQVSTSSVSGYINYGVFN